MKWVSVGVPSTVEALAHRFALACKQEGFHYASISANDGSLTGICIQDGECSPLKSLYLIDGEWCEYVEVGDGK